MTRCRECGCIDGHGQLCSRKPVELSQLGRSVDPGKVDLQAHMAREALDRVARELWDRDASNKAAAVVKSMRDIVAYADNETLSQLYRMLKS